jgi:hypothetical protein
MEVGRITNLEPTAKFNIVENKNEEVVKLLHQIDYKLSLLLSLFQVDESQKDALAARGSFVLRPQEENLSG